MLIDNLRDRYPNDGMDITTVWDFINFFAGEDSGQKRSEVRRMDRDLINV